MNFFRRFFLSRQKLDQLVNARSNALLSDQINKIKRQCGYVDGSSPGRSVFGDYHSGGAKFRGGLSYSDTGIILDHAVLRRNARQAYSNDSLLAKTIIDRSADHIAGKGLRVEFAPKHEILGISEVKAEAWARDVESRFDLWARDKKQHRSEQITWYQSHRQNVIYQRRDGEVFQRLYYSTDKSLQNPLQFEFIDSDQINGDAYTSTVGVLNNYGADGIGRDDRGRESEYTIWVIKPGEKYIGAAGQQLNNYSYEYIVVPKHAKDNGMPYMLHAFAAEYAGQGRGYSALSHAIQEFQDLTTFGLANIRKAINQSNLVFAVKPSPNNPASNPFEGMIPNGTSGPASQQFGANPAPASDAQNVTDESTVPVTCYRLPEAPFEVPGSTVVANLEEGEDLKSVVNTAPSDSYDNFVDSFSSYLAASLSIPLEIVLMKFNQNYSASRAALILFWRVGQVWQQEMAADLLNPTVEAWLTGEIAAGRVKAPGWQDRRLRAAWLNCNWIGDPMPNIDPHRTAQADKAYVEMGAQSLARVAKDFNGSDADANSAKLRREFAKLPSAPWAKNNDNNDKNDNKENDKNDD